MARQNIANIWASSGASTNPGASKTNLGWIAEIPTFQNFNWWMNRVDQMLEHLEKNGVAAWSASTTYLVDGLALGSDGVLYQAVISQSGNDPTVDAGTNWRSLVCDGDFTATGGYVIFNSRPALIVQWGTTNVGADLTATEFSQALPIAFPSVFAFAGATDDETSDAGILDIGAARNGLTGIYLQNAEDAATDINWLAIGW